MLSRKRKDKPKYLAARKRVRELIYEFRTWGCKDPVDILDISYKIASFFDTYYSCFERGASKQLLLLQSVSRGITEENINVYIVWRMVAALSISNALEMYKMLNIDLRLEHIRGESFYAGIPPITQEEIDLALKIRSLYSELQPFMEVGVHDFIAKEYDVLPGEYGEQGYDNINDIPSIMIPSPSGKIVSFCPAIMLDDGKYHIWNR